MDIHNDWALVLLPDGPAPQCVLLACRGRGNESTRITSNINILHGQLGSVLSLDQHNTAVLFTKGSIKHEHELVTSLAMASNGCPQEIVDLIVDFFIGPAEPDPQLLAPISLVSRTWSYAVSRRLWDAITVENDLDGIHRFRDTYSNPRHRDHLRVVTYTNCVPLDTPVLTDAFGNPFFSNVSMSQAYFGVFGLFLATVNRLFDHDERKNLALRIEPGRQPWFHYGSYYQWNTPPHLFLMPFDARFMLPAVRAVTRLFIGGDGYDEPTVHPSMVNVILRSFPNVEELEWMMASPALSEKVERGVHWNGMISMSLPIRT